MRSLLTFTGSVISFFVLIIIAPLLLAVYAGLETVYMIRYLKQRRSIFIIHLPEIKFPASYVPLKKYFSHALAKAARFHL